MALKTFAAIHVGSGEVYLKIYELSRKTGLHLIDYASYCIELGSDTFTQGYIGHELVYELCSVLKGFRMKMEEYRIEQYTAYAGSAVREARNCDLILDQIRIRTGLNVTCVSNAEQSFLMLKAAAGSISSFQKLLNEGALIADVGAGSLQITIYESGKMIFTHSFKLGALRIREVLSNLEGQSSDFGLVMNDYIGNDFDTLSVLVGDAKIRHIIAVGEEIQPVLVIAGTEGDTGTFKPEKLREYYNKIQKMGFDDIAQKYSISYEAATLIKPVLTVYRNLVKIIHADTIWLSRVNLCDGIAEEYYEKLERKQPLHDFSEDILNHARAISDHYEAYNAHTENVAGLSLTIFDGLRRYADLHSRDRILLEMACLFHDTGKYINLTEATDCSYQIVMSTEFMGISQSEQRIIASMIKYNSGKDVPLIDEMDHHMDQKDYIRMIKLSAILRIARALDRSHRQKINKIAISVKDKKMVIRADTIYDITLEQSIIEEKGRYFESIYGLRPVLRVKKR